MSDLVLFTLNAIVIYVLADRITSFLTRRSAWIAQYRQVAFFVVFLVLALVTFRLLQMMLGPPGGA